VPTTSVAVDRQGGHNARRRQSHRLAQRHQSLRRPRRWAAVSSAVGGAGSRIGPASHGPALPDIAWLSRGSRPGSAGPGIASAVPGVRGLLHQPQGPRQGVVLAVSRRPADTVDLMMQGTMRAKRQCPGMPAMRTCVGCRSVRQSILLRLVTAGDVIHLPAGPAAWPGAYLHPIPRLHGPRRVRRRAFPRALSRAVPLILEPLAEYLRGEQIPE